MVKNFCLIIGMFLIMATLKAQSPAVQQTIEDLMESVNTELNEEADFQELIDDLTYLSQHPLSINKASKEEFQRLHFISDVQIEALIEFRTKTGQIYSIYEMTAIEGFNPDLLQKMKPFLNFEVQEPLNKSKKTTNDLFVRSTRTFSDSQSGAGNSNYEGSMERYYLRYKHISNDLEYGMVAEKDPGESFFAGSNKYTFDDLGVYGNFKIGKGGQKIFHGNYRVSFGQGLVANQGFSMGKSSETTQLFHSGQGIRSSSSTDGSQYFTGIAAQLKSGIFTFTPFFSYRTLDASIDTVEGITYFGAIQTSGYHRTKSEIASENSLAQLTSGSSATFSYKRWSIGLTGIFTSFNSIMDRSEEPSNQFLWEGKENLVGGIDWKGSIKNIFIFGEAALSANNGKAFLSGVLLKPSSNTEFSALYRNINKTYFSFYASAFTESPNVNDENGMYLGLKFFPTPHWTIRCYGDFFEYRWIKYTTAAPSNGTELFAQVTFNPSKTTELYLRFFQEEKKVKVINDNYKFNESQQINRLRLNISHQINESFGLKSRIDFSAYSKSNKEKGFLVCQDLIYKPLNRTFSMNGRISYFKTDGYNSRQYAYENDVLYSFSMPVLYGKGIRAYLNLKQALSENLTFWIKAAATHRFLETETTQSIESETKSEFKIQLQYQF